IILIIVGLFSIYSASIYSAYYAGESILKYLAVQTIGIVLGISIYFTSIVISYRFYLQPKMIAIALLVCLSTLIFVLTTPAVLGASRWISLGPLRFQPAELLKIVYVLFISYWFATFEQHCRLTTIRIFQWSSKKSKQQYQKVWYQFGVYCGIPLAITAVFGILLRQQPDNGSIIVMLILLFVIVSAVFVKRYVTLGLLSLLLITAIFALSAKEEVSSAVLQKIPSESHISVRFRAWMDPFADYEGDGYQLANSYIAIAKGGIFGVGNANGTQKQGFLPEVHTDFILANIAEEHGLVGIGIICLLFFILTNRILLAALRIQDKQAKLTLLGLATLLLIQFVWNAGGISGLLPMKGLTAPFLSYGGTSVLFMISTLGICQGIIANEKYLLRKN
ncbi:MAG: FtsW/RodA/SpoVE family cell cycle protein, partial [Culicoidibacterales bacterium]